MLRAQSSCVRLTAVPPLGIVGEPAFDLLRWTTEDRDSSVQEEAFSTIARLGVRAIPLLRWLVSNHPTLGKQAAEKLKALNAAGR